MERREGDAVHSPNDDWDIEERERERGREREREREEAREREEDVSERLSSPFPVPSQTDRPTWATKHAYTDHFYTDKGQSNKLAPSSAAP